MYLDNQSYADETSMETFIASHMMKLPDGTWVCTFCNKASRFKSNIGRLNLCICVINCLLIKLRETLKKVITNDVLKCITGFYIRQVTFIISMGNTLAYKHQHISFIEFYFHFFHFSIRKEVHLSRDLYFLYTIGQYSFY